MIYKELLKRDYPTTVFVGYDLEQIDCLEFEFDVEDHPAYALVWFPKSAINPNELELVTANEVMPLLQDKDVLLDFVQSIANGNREYADAARSVIAGLKSKNNQLLDKFLTTVNYQGQDAKFISPHPDGVDGHFSCSL